jgi:nucleotide-binding universal stress UspA family protein
MSNIARILFPFDFSAQCTQTAPAVRAMAARLGATVTLCSIVPPIWETPPEGMGRFAGDDPATWKHDLQARLVGALEEELAGIEVERVADVGDPAIRIRSIADERKADLIMMPTHGRGTFRALLVGSVTSKVLHDAACPVWTAVHTEAQSHLGAPRTILCAVDGHDRTPDVLRWTADFGASLGATIRLLHVVQPISDWTSLASERSLQEGVRQAAEARVASMQRDAGIVAPLDVVVGEIDTAVAEHARLSHADVVIVGRGAVAGNFPRLRAHTFAIIQRSPCPVLNV